MMQSTTFQDVVSAPTGASGVAEVKAAQEAMHARELAEREAAAATPAEALAKRLADLAARTAQAERRKQAESRQEYRRLIRRCVDGETLNDSEVGQLQASMERLDVSESDLAADVKALESAIQQAQRVTLDDDENRRLRDEHQARDAELRAEVDARKAKLQEAEQAVRDEHARYSRHTSYLSTLRALVNANPRIFQRVDGTVISPTDVGVEKSKTMGRHSS